MQSYKNLEELLRETACLGDVEKVGVLVRAKVDVNSRNSVNGWTPLHWAARRNHKDVVTYLLQHGANPSIRSFKDELAADVTQSEDIKFLLLSEEGNDTKNCSSNYNAVELSNLESCTPKEKITEFVPNYLLNPAFPYSESPKDFATRIGIQKLGLATQDCGLPSSDQITFNGSMSPCNDADKVEMVTLDKTSTTAVNNSALVLKCRIADSEERDFIEIELDQKCVKYEALKETCAAELNVDLTKLKKIRKLPNTIIRNDKDVKRLVQYQELEIVIQ
ncbi:ankyrin repeat domain-containing protein 40-like [Dendronephthya gigantea]|uniref:ankyrin repeat domain-containing protein 40-like n=1 Tax=Dendronephthya gigantea TaxID=151771 RepID=UPI0010695FBB|nr:ankyrin repeat domain-containing protein 40-like [Dendronephthya gigantea]